MPRLRDTPGLDPAVLEALASCSPPILTLEALLEGLASARAQTKLPDAQLFGVVEAVCASVSAEPVRGDVLLGATLTDGRLLSTGCVGLNDMLEGGLVSGEVTEVAGPTGVGKTQACLSATASAVLAVPETVVYIDTTAGFSARRLKDIVEAQFVAHFEVLGRADADSVLSEVQTDCLSRVNVMRAYDADGLLAALQKVSDACSGDAAAAAAAAESAAEPTTEGPTAPPVLLVVDSVSAVVAPVLGGSNNASGHAVMMAIARLLVDISRRHNVATLVTNHSVSDRAGPRGRQPSMGASWLSVPDVRVWMDNTGGSPHTAHLVRSNRLRLPRSTEFTIGEYGLQPHATLVSTTELKPLTGTEWVKSFLGEVRPGEGGATAGDE